MSALDPEGDRDITLRFSAREGLTWGTVVAGALWADLTVGLGLFGIYSQWAAHRMFQLAGSVTFTVGLSAPLFLLLFTVAAAWVTVAYIGAQSQEPATAWSSHRSLAVGTVVGAGIILLLAAGSTPRFSGQFLSLHLLLSLLLSLLLIGDGIVAAWGTVRFFRRSRV